MRGRDGRLYNGKGTKGGLAAQTSPVPQSLPSLPQKVPVSKLSAEPSAPSLPLSMLHPLSHNSKIVLPEPPYQMQEIAFGIEEDAATIEFPNHNDECADDWLTLDVLLDKNMYFQNNCHALSSELTELLYHQYSYSDEVSEISTVQLSYGYGVHAAVKVELDGEPWILDYTARQFDSTLPNPLIIPEGKWEALIDYYVWTQYFDSRTNHAT